MAFEQRRYPRRPFDFVVGVLHKGKYTVFQSFEIGERGAGIESELELQVDEIMVVSFYIQSQFVICQAVVRYILEAPGAKRYGVEFTNIKFEDRRNIRDYIAVKGDAETLFARMIAGQNK